MKNKAWILLLNVAIFISILTFSPLEAPLTKGLAIFSFVALLWIFEIFHVSITSLLVPILAVSLGIFDLTSALKNFANPIIFLFLGGFSLAAAMHKHQLDSAIANKVLQFSHGNMLLSAILVFVLTAFISMWISNTATIAMMLPLILGLLSRLSYQEHKTTYLFFLLGAAYSASIGGMGTIVGSPPNAIAAAATGIDFATWMTFGIPIVILSLPIMITVLYLVLKPDLSHDLLITHSDFEMTPERWRISIIFLFTVCGWIFSSQLAELFNINKGFDALVALVAIVLLAASQVISWQEIEQSTEWGVLLLFGGGITLSAILKVTGTSAYLATMMSESLSGAAIVLFLIISIAFVVFMTELTSNTASTALLVPIFISIANSLQLSSSTIAVAIALSASCAFMLPVATPPNAIVFGSGYVPQPSMMKTGFALNITFILVISFLALMFI